MALVEVGEAILGGRFAGRASGVKVVARVVGGDDTGTTAMAWGAASVGAMCSCLAFSLEDSFAPSMFVGVLDVPRDPAPPYRRNDHAKTQRREEVIPLRLCVFA